MEETEITEQLPQEAVEVREDQEIQQPEAEAPRDDFAIFEEHIRGLEAQSEEMQKTWPGFDLRQELKNPVFLQLTAPGTGITVEDAYYALHRKELQQAAAQETTEKIVRSIQSGSRRPLEAGTTTQAPSLITFQYGSATKEQRDAFKKELRRAWGRGEQVFP